MGARECQLLGASTTCLETMLHSFEPVQSGSRVLASNSEDSSSRQDLAPSPDTWQIASRPSWCFSFRKGMQNTINLLEQLS